ncbi:unnamed protein product, partial [Discosporangium mesarthrocarpum]
AEVAPLITVVGLMQPLNSFVFAGDGVLQGSQDFVYEALSMVTSGTVAIAYVAACSGGFWANASTATAVGAGSGAGLIDVWVGICVLQACRALTFSARYWLDPRSPLAVVTQDQTDNSRNTTALSHSKK